jgi:diguanylate cyclase (GGDEF)-like protein
MEQLKAEWNRCMRHQQPITIIIIDIDHFKKLNDRYGHNKGDECLIEIAGVLDSMIRRTGEFVARIGGEEFAIVLPNAKSRTAIKLAEKIRNDLSLISFSHKKEKFHISASMGIACTTPEIGSDCERLFVAADEALYQAKDAGRNRYQLASINCK